MSARTTLPESVRFQDTELTIIDHNGTPWIASIDLARALGMRDRRGVHNLWTRYKDEFSPDMSEVLNLGTSGNLQKSQRIFSPRGCHLVAMFARTECAKAFRKWVLDILEGIAAPPALPRPKTLTNAQRRAIQKLMQEKWLDNDERRDAYDRLKRRFDVARYRDIEKTQIYKAIDFILSDAPDAGASEVRLSLPIERPEVVFDDATRIAEALYMVNDCPALVDALRANERQVEGALRALRGNLAALYDRMKHARCHAGKFLGPE
ncbi:MAG: BRO family protein [Hyphomicrobiales bacterium]